MWAKVGELKFEANNNFRRRTAATPAPFRPKCVCDDQKWRMSRGTNGVYCSINGSNRSIVKIYMNGFSGGVEFITLATPRLTAHTTNWAQCFCQLEKQ